MRSVGPKRINAEITRSNRKNKKLVARFTYKGKKYTIHFGDKRYQHYRDKTGYYSSQDHNDLDRRRRYRKRASKIKNKKGLYTFQDPTSPNYFSYYVLW